MTMLHLECNIPTQILNQPPTAVYLAVVTYIPGGGDLICITQPPTGIFQGQLNYANVYIRGLLYKLTS